MAVESDSAGDGDGCLGSFPLATVYGEFSQDVDMDAQEVSSSLSPSQSICFMPLTGLHDVATFLVHPPSSPSFGGGDGLLLSPLCEMSCPLSPSPLSSPLCPFPSSSLLSSSLSRSSFAPSVLPSCLLPVAPALQAPPPILLSSCYPLSPANFPPLGLLAPRFSLPHGSPISYAAMVAPPQLATPPSPQLSPSTAQSVPDPPPLQQVADNSSLGKDFQPRQPLQRLASTRPVIHFAPPPLTQIAKRKSKLKNKIGRPPVALGRKRGRPSLRQVPPSHYYISEAFNLLLLQSQGHPLCTMRCDLFCSWLGCSIGRFAFRVAPSPAQDGLKVRSFHLDPTLFSAHLDALSNRSVVAYIMGKPPFADSVKRFGVTHWERLNAKVLSSQALGKGVFLFNFFSAQEVNSVLANGPYLYAGNPVYVTKYTGAFTIHDSSQMEVSVWIETLLFSSQALANFGCGSP
ncbi:hypothetical protein O6H91_16G064900 [Diphasiastrum complanatum]|uniref:Uncharacterized protein n=1 Tax=Diphasiastrum complanatum TaxID=34168 RepID=A0ACC2BCX8_DIPCM|nr:hypothetical protein O6H91_16G064900 [Diphasiastrum complanatum]